MDATGEATTAHLGGGPSYVATDAWRRAGTYFVACIVVAVATGALDQVVADRGAQRTGSWSGVAVLAWVVVVVGYGLVWPRGTYVEDRPARPLLQPAFGAVWGLCQGLLFVSVHRMVASLGLSWALTGALAWLLVAGFQGVWHDRWWDRFVSPPHNVPAWNPIKVAACHVPNLTLSMLLLARWGDAQLFVALQAIALMFSATAMRFPPPGYVRGPGVVAA